MDRGAKKKLPAVAGRIFGEDKAVDVRYRPSPPELAEVALAGSAAEIERILLASYGRWLGPEVRARRALVGPQRDDLEIRLDGEPAGLHASAGEQRRVAFVLLMAAVELAAEGRPGATILLIDDVDAEFDDRRLDRVFEYLAQAGQALVATAKAEVARRYAKLGATLAVTAGRIVVA
jgi:DNA replication and repair protein RecF